MHHQQHDRPGSPREVVIELLFLIDPHRRDRVREAIKAASVPMPAELVDEIADLNSRDAREVLREHPGFTLWERLKSHEVSLQVFERSVEDLLRCIDDLNELSQDQLTFHRTRRAELDKIELAIQKELFAATNAAHALVDHTRRLQSMMDVPDYNPRRVEYFKADGLHDFVIGFRTIVHHIQIVRANWQVSGEFGKAGHSATFKLDRDELSLLKGEMNALGRGYLKKAPKDIDLRQVFEEYRRRVRAFQSWYSEAMATRLEGARDYERCLKENTRATTRMCWKSTLRHCLSSEQPPDPYKHLDRYLSPEQIFQVHALPMRSQQQVDKIIEAIDKDGACDEGLRQLAYELFRRTAPLPADSCEEASGLTS